MTRGRGHREVRENVRRDLLESRTGLKTPEYFWKCPGCKKKGCVIDGRDVVG